MISERELPLLAPLMHSAGITRVANVTGLDDIGIPVFMVVRPDARSLSVSQGKGVTLQAARISGIMESLEQYHAERIASPLTLATYAELRRRRRVVDVHRLSRSFRALHEATRILWISGKDAASHESVAVPFEMVHLDMTIPLPEGSGYFPLCSNGLASGETLPEAIAHGVWELIERDALALFFQLGPAGQAARRVSLNSIDDPLCSGLLRRLEAANVGAAVWNMTSDIGIAAFMCSIGERELNPLRHVGTARGYGCHPERGIALRRAITEAALGRLTRISGTRDDIQPVNLREIRSRQSIEHQQAHLEQEGCAQRRFEATPTRMTESTERALAWTLTQLARCGMRDVVYVELSEPSSPIAVARSIIPGLEGYPDSPSYVPGPRALRVRQEPRA